MNFAVKSSIRNALLTLLIISQALLAYFVISASMRSPELRENEGRHTSVPPKLEESSLHKLYKARLLTDTRIDASDWNVDANFFRHLQERPIKNIREMIFNRSVNDEAISYLRGNPVSHLSIVNGHATTKCLPDLAAIPTLDWLEINNMNLKPDDLEIIVNMKNLSSLRAENCQLDDESLKILNKHNWKLLAVNHNPSITNKGVEYLSHQKSRTLCFGATKVDDQGAAILAGMPTLERIELFLDNVDDKSLPLFSKMPHLYLLFMRSTPITDRGLDQFKPPASLRIFMVYKCPNLTQPAALRFHKKYPQIFLESEHIKK